MAPGVAEAGPGGAERARRFPTSRCRSSTPPTTSHVTSRAMPRAAEDIVQDAYLRALRGFDGTAAATRGPGSWKTVRNRSR